MMREQIVTKSNKMIDAVYTLSLLEQWIILYVISEIESRDTSNINNKFKIYLRHFKKIFDVELHKTKEELEEVIHKLYQRTVLILDPHNEKAKNDYLETRWISSKLYKEKEGYIEVTLAEDIKPYLSDLKKQLSQYHLKHIIQFTSIYAIRLYEISIKWLRIGKTEHTVQLDWLKHYFQIKNKYKTIWDFKHRVLEPAIKQINDYTDIHIHYEQLKQGRKITDFVFHFAFKDLTQIDMPVKNTEMPDTPIEEKNNSIDWQAIYAYVEQQGLTKAILQQAQQSRDMITLQAYEKEGLQAPELQTPIYQYLVTQGLLANI